MATAYEEEVARRLEGLHYVSPGLCSSCKTCQQLYNLSEKDLAAAYESGRLVDEGHPSKADCEACGQSLAGNRYEAHAVPEDGDVIHLSICEDCLFYFANGDVPEKWP